MAIKIDLSQELGADQFVNVRDPRLMSWKTQKAIAAAAKDESMESNMAVAEAVTLALIVDGNLVDENGQAIAFPLNAETLDRMPAVVIERVAEKFGELKAVPKK